MERFEPEQSIFRKVPMTGVIYVSNEAKHLGYEDSDADWCNLGQGQPETGQLEKGPPRLSNIPLLESDREYAPVWGLEELRQSVADFYNRRFRKGLGSKYSAENVSIVAGGRLGMARAMATLGHVNVGHFLPDYTAYEELLDVFKTINPIPILLEGDQQYAFGAKDLEREILGRGISALLFSNPCNPTGRCLEGDSLQAFVDATQAFKFSLISDEFYSHYIWNSTHPSRPKMISAASHIEDIESQDVLILDGLTKNWRYPGLRLAWIVGPKKRMRSIHSAGSFLDGGAPAPIQRAAIDLLTDEVIDAENQGIFHTFKPKRDYLLKELKALGLHIDLDPEGSFYIWASVKNLPQPFNTDLGFFRALLKEKIICVPGRFFDVNPGRRRSNPSRFSSHVRISFGPSMEVLKKAISRLKRLL